MRRAPRASPTEKSFAMPGSIFDQASSPLPMLSTALVSLAKARQARAAVAASPLTVVSPTRPCSLRYESKAASSWDCSADGYAPRTAVVVVMAGAFWSVRKSRASCMLESVLPTRPTSAAVACDDNDEPSSLKAPSAASAPTDP